MELSPAARIYGDLTPRCRRSTTLSSDAVSVRRAGPEALAAWSPSAPARPGTTTNLPTSTPPLSWRDLAPWLPLPVQGDTLTLWEALASLGTVDLTVARVDEPDLDALAILRRRGATVRSTKRSGVGSRRSGATLARGMHAVEGNERLQVALAVRGVSAARLPGCPPTGSGRS